MTVTEIIYNLQSGFLMIIRGCSLKYCSSFQTQQESFKVDRIELKTLEI